MCLLCACFFVYLRNAQKARDKVLLMLFFLLPRDKVSLSIRSLFVLFSSSVSFAEHKTSLQKLSSRKTSFKAKQKVPGDNSKIKILSLSFLRLHLNSFLSLVINAHRNSSKQFSSWYTFIRKLISLSVFISSLFYFPCVTRMARGRKNSFPFN